MKCIKKCTRISCLGCDWDGLVSLEFTALTMKRCLIKSLTKLLAATMGVLNHGLGVNTLFILYLKISLQ